VNKTTTLFILCFFLLKNFIAQDNAFVKGKVSDKSGSSLPGAIISVDPKKGTVSDVDGNYILSVSSGTYNLECSLIGYKNQKQNITVNPSDTLVVNFVLSDANAVLEEVVVSAGRYEQKLSEVTVSMEVIKPSLIENKNSTSLDVIMNQVPGVTVSDGQASIRGGSGFAYGAGSRVLVSVDEMPMLSADAGDVKWNYLPLENIEQVEVIKGASSALFGSSALNGVINLRTAYAKDKPMTSVSAFYGGYDAPRHQYKWWKGSSQTMQGMNFSHAEKIGNLDLVLGGHLYNDDGYRGGRVYTVNGVDTTTEVKNENERRQRFNANLRYNFKKLPGLSIGVNTNMMDVKGGLFFLWKHADSAYVPNDIQKYKNVRFNIDPYITYFIGNHKISFRNRYYLTKNTNDKDQEATAELYYNELQYQGRFRGDLNLTIGVVNMQQQIFSDSLYGRHTGKNIAGYLQIDKKIKRLTASLGLRGEYYKIDTAYTRGYINSKINNLPFQPVLRAGLNYQLFNYTFLRTSFGQGYRFPAVAEKYVSTNVGALKIFPNSSLQPEYGWSAELGIKQGFSISKFKGFLDIAGFWTEYKNMVEFVFDYYIPPGMEHDFTNLFNYAGFQSRNVGPARITGFEISLTGAGKIGPVNVTVLTGYMYINPINPSYDPIKDTLGLPYLNVLKYRNRNTFKNDIQFDYKFISVGYSVRYQSFMENIDQRFMYSVFHELNPLFDQEDRWYILPGLRKYREKHNGGDWIHDLRIGFQITKRVKLSYICNNFTNAEYSSRPGDVRPPTTHMGQLLFKF
jgi:iron complex outermembrane receptor protein